MFIDASAMVAILTMEPEAAVFSTAMERNPAPITSAVAIFEAALAISRKRQGGVEAAERDVEDFVRLTNTRIVSIGAAEAHEALRAFAIYGKGRGKPAQLNMGDCFAYASAREANCALLYKGNDFIHTDIPSALAP